MKKEKLGRKLGTLVLTGIIASSAILPCTVNATELIKEDGSKVARSEFSAKKGKKQGGKAKSSEQSSGDTLKMAEKKEKYENLTDEEKEAIKAEREAKKAEKKAKYESLTDEEKEALKAERKAKKQSKNHGKAMRKQQKGKKSSDTITE